MKTETRRKRTAKAKTADAILIPNPSRGQATKTRGTAIIKRPHPVLYEVRLPAGRVAGFDVAFRGDNRTRYDLPAGYGGFRFVGAGRSLTHVAAEADVYHDSSVFVGPFNGPCFFESMTIHGARRKALHAGLANNPVLPNFAIRMRDCDVVAERGADGSRPAWGTFGYQVDLDLEDVDFYWIDAVEHASYAHGFSRAGLRWSRVRVQGSGAEGCKIRNTTLETRWVKGARVSLTDCSFKDWYQPWSWRGGAGVVLQGGGCDVLIERCTFWGGAQQKSRCIMIDDGSGDFYDAVTGEKGTGYANGFVVVKQCSMQGGPGPDWYGTITRIGNLATGHKVARGVLVESCGVWGDHVLGQFADSPLEVRGCNTPAIRDYCNAIGMDTTYEAQIAGNPLVPFSHGVTR